MKGFLKARRSQGHLSKRPFFLGLLRIFSGIAIFFEDPSDFLRVKGIHSYCLSNLLFVRNIQGSRSIYRRVDWSVQMIRTYSYAKSILAVFCFMM